MKGNVKRKPGVFPSEKPGDKNQVGRTGYRQKFSKALDQSEYDSVQNAQCFLLMTLLGLRNAHSQGETKRSVANNSKLRTLIGSVCCRYCPSMDKDKGLCQTETKTVSRCGSALLAPEKPVKNMWQVLFGYAAAGILDNNDSIFGRFFDDYVN